MKPYSLVVQLNHPGTELEFKRLNRDYFEENGKIIRAWNTRKTHFRKFICHKGEYINSIGEMPIKSDLLFWGEWEGYSEFVPSETEVITGTHFPFYRSCKGLEGNIQNTDPYIYGDEFKYATCKQKGKLLNLEKGSLILFGSSYSYGFVLDTVFVVGSCETKKSVYENDAKNYTEIYRNATLQHIGYLNNNEPNNKSIYSGVTYSENKEIFSYAPCKSMSKDNEVGFPRVTFDFNELGLDFCSNYSCVKYLSKDRSQTYNIWKKITDKVIKDGYSLGLNFEEPLIR
jgi:hypothetical protein